MTNRPSDLSTILADVRRRWTLRSLLRALTGGTLAAAVITLAGFGAVSLVAGEGLPLVATAALVLTLALLTFGYAFWPYRRTPSDRQIARYIEERVTDLDDVVVTAVDASQRPDLSGRMRELLASDAARALAALDLDRVIPRQSIKQAGLRAADPGADRQRLTGAHLRSAWRDLDGQPGRKRIGERDAGRPRKRRSDQRDGSHQHRETCGGAQTCLLD